MNIGILLPGFSKDTHDWAIPIQQNLMRKLSKTEDVRVIALRYPFTRLPYRIYDAQVYPLGAGSYARGRRRLALWWAALRLIRRLHHEKPFDVLHGMWADETGLLTAWSGRQLGIPVVVSPMGGELVGFRDIDYGLQQRRFSRWIVGQALNGADAITVPGSHTRERIAEANYVIPDQRIHRIALGVDTTVFYPQGDYQPNHLIHVGSLVPIKDQTTLLRAVAQLEHVTLDIIGDGPLRPSLERLAQDLGLTQRVKFVGAVNHLDLPLYYRRAAVHVVTSRNETGPLATVEAAACGVPTVSTDVGFLRDYPTLGLTVPVGDMNALVAAIRDLLANTEHYKKLRSTALETVQSSLTIQHTAQHFKTLYTRLALSQKL